MASSYRRRRLIWSAVILSAFLLFYVSTHDAFSFLSLPQSLKDLGFDPSSSRAGQVAIAKFKEVALSKQRVREIDALLHFVTEHPDRRLNEEDGSINVEGVGLVKVDPEESIDFSVYSPDGDYNWESHLRVLKGEHPLVVFSKTYCPFSQRAKSLLESYSLDPPPIIVELNTRADGPLLQKILSRLTGRRTVPNVLLLGESIGGSDDIHALHEVHKLKGILEKGGLEVNGVTAGLQVHAV